MPASEFYRDYLAWIDAMWPIEPIHYVNHASPTPLLFQNAVQDEYVSVDDAIRYQDMASEPKEVIWYESGHWPLPDQVVTDSARWLQPFVGSGRLYVVPAPNYRPSAIIMDRLLLVWGSLTGVSLAFLIWDLRRRDDRFPSGGAKWITLVALTGAIGSRVYSMRRGRLSERADGGLVATHSREEGR